MENFAYRLTKRAAINSEERATGSVDYHGVTSAIERNKRRGHAGYNSFTESFGGVGALAGLVAKLLECLTLFLELRDNRLKSLEDKLGFISRLRRPGLNRGFLRLTHQLAVRTEHPA